MQLRLGAEQLGEQGLEWSSRLRPLPTTLVCEVQSPGFSGRLSSLVASQREEEEACKLKLAPLEPYSPFPRYSGQGLSTRGPEGQAGKGGELRPQTGYSSSC